MPEYCCLKFQEKAENYNTPVAGGLLFPDPNPVGQFERDQDGTWNINGCCGGGCFVVDSMKFCPFCGEEVKSG